MAIDVVAIGTNQDVAAGTALSVTVPVGGVALGRRAIVSFCSNNADTDAEPTCADSRGNTYVRDEHVTVAARRLITFSAPVTTALVLNDTITVTSVSATRRTIGARHANVGAKDVGVGATGSSTSPSSGATAQRAVAESLLFGVCGWNDSVGTDVFTLGAGFTAKVQVTAHSASAGRQLATEYQIMAAVGTEAATGTISVSSAWSMMAIAYPAQGGQQAVRATNSYRRRRTA